MNASTKRRIVIYGVTAIAVFGLGFASLQAKARTDREEIGTLLNGGELFAKLGMFAEADEAANEVLSRDAGNRDAMLLLAYNAQQRMDRPAAVKHYREALARSEHDEQRRMIRVTIADVLRADHRYEEAASEIAQCRKTWGDSPRLALAEAALWSVQGNHDGAIRRVEDACAHDSVFPRAQLTKAWVLRSANKPAEALTVLESIAERNGLAPRVWYEIASVRNELGDRDGAIAAMTESMKRKPRITRRMIADERATWENILPAELLGRATTETNATPVASKQGT